MCKNRLFSAFLSTGFSCKPSPQMSQYKKEFACKLSARERCLQGKIHFRELRILFLYNRKFRGIFYYRTKNLSCEILALTRSHIFYLRVMRIYVFIQQEFLLHKKTYKLKIRRNVYDVPALLRHLRKNPHPERSQITLSTLWHPSCRIKYQLYRIQSDEHGCTQSFSETLSGRAPPFTPFSHSQIKYKNSKQNTACSNEFF